MEARRRFARASARWVERWGSAWHTAENRRGHYRSKSAATMNTRTSTHNAGAHGPRLLLTLFGAGATVALREQWLRPPPNGSRGRRRISPRHRRRQSSASVIHTGAWSLGLSRPRTSRSTPAPV